MPVAVPVRGALEFLFRRLDLYKRYGETASADIYLSAFGSNRFFYHAHGRDSDIATDIRQDAAVGKGLCGYDTNSGGVSFYSEIFYGRHDPWGGERMMNDADRTK